MALAPDPAEVDSFKPVRSARRTGGMTLDEWMDWLAHRPDATLPSGVGGMLAQEILRLREHTGESSNG